MTPGSAPRSPQPFPEIPRVEKWNWVPTHKHTQETAWDVREGRTGQGEALKHCPQGSGLA